MTAVWNKEKPLLWLKRHRPAVLMGGWSRERSISLKTGAAVVAAFKRLAVGVVPIDVKPDIERVLKRKKIDFCFLALHGTFGEDGGIQALLDVLKIPYTGCGAASSALAMDKHFSKCLFKKHGVLTAPWVLLQKDVYEADKKQALALLAAQVGRGPWFVKPADQGSALGAGRADTSASLKKRIAAAFHVSDRVMVEPFVRGRELTVGVLGGRALPVIEICPTHAFYDFHSKYAKGGSRHLVPAPLKSSIAKQAQVLSRKAFAAVGGEVYGRVDLILTPKGELLTLEVNTIPGMTETSLLPEAAKAHGLSFDDLVLKIVDVSLQERLKKASS